MKTNQQLVQDYNSACNELLKVFCIKHDLPFDSANWIGETGSMVCIDDFCIDMETIITDIKENAPVDEFLKWYDYVAELQVLGDNETPSFWGWLNGCTRRSPQEIIRLKELHSKIEEQKREFEHLLNPKSSDQPFFQTPF